MGCRVCRNLNGNEDVHDQDLNENEDVHDQEQTNIDDLDQNEDEPLVKWHLIHPKWRRMTHA